MSERWEPVPPEYVDEEVRLMCDAETLARGMDVLDPDAKMRVKAYILEVLCIDAVEVDELVAYLRREQAEGDEWQGETCPDCGELHGLGVPHECRSESLASGGQRYGDIGR
jgi:hypothetical protein